MPPPPAPPRLASRGSPASFRRTSSCVIMRHHTCVLSRAAIFPFLLLTKRSTLSMSNSASIMTEAESRRRRASSLALPRTSCRRSIGLGLVLLLSLVGTTLAASSIPPLSVLNSRRVSAHDRDAAAAAVGAAKKCHLSSQLSLLSSCRGGAAAAAAAVETQEGVGPMEVFLHTIKEARRHLAAAAVARSVSIFGMCEFTVFSFYVCFAY